MAIDRRSFLKVAVGSAAAALIDPRMGSNGSLASQERRERRRPNVLFIMTDQQPLSGVQGYGNPVLETPHVARLAAEGVLCEDFYISGFPCTPARSVLATGQWPHTTGIVTNGVELPNDYPSMGHHFSSAGYRTHYVGKWHLGGEVYRGVEVGGVVRGGKFVVTRGPDGFVVSQAPGGLGEDGPNGGFTDSYVGGWNHYKQYLRDVGMGEHTRDPWVGGHQQRPSSGDDRHAFSQIPAAHHMSAFLAGSMEKVVRDEAAGDEPWCGVLSFYGPHLPVAPPRPWDERYAMSDVRLPANFNDPLTAKPASQRRGVFVRPRWKEAQFADYIRRYWGFCSYIDEQIGRVLTALDETGQMENTVIVFTSDHGDMMGEHGMIYKLPDCGYEALIRVPLIVRYPARLKAGTRVKGFAEQIDLLSTVMDLADVEAPTGTDGPQGRSFAPLLEGTGPPNEDDVQVDMMNRCWTVRTAMHKAVFHWAARDGAELYSLEDDPGEVENLAATPGHRATLADLLGRMEDRLARTGHPYREQMIDAARRS